MAMPVAFSSPNVLSSPYPLSHLHPSRPPPSLLLTPLRFHFSTFRALPRLPLTVIQCTKKEAPPSVDPKVGVSVYKPKSYEVLITDAANSLAYALNDGKIRLEIDFPPLPSDISSYKGSSDEFIDANIQLALAIVRKLKERKETRACIVFPDKPEKRRATQIFKTAIDSIDGISIGSLDDVPSGAVTTFFRSIRSTLDFDFDDENEVLWKNCQKLGSLVKLTWGWCFRDSIRPLAAGANAGTRGGGEGVNVISDRLGEICCSQMPQMGFL